MYQKIECVCLVCDNCGEGYMDEHTGFSIYLDESAANDAADNDEWSLHGEDGKHYCPKCYKIDGDDNLIVDQSRRKSQAL